MQFDQELDARGLRCPLPILRCKKALAELQPGQVLRILATDHASARDFQTFSQQTGHVLLLSEEREGVYLFWMRKHATSEVAR